MDEDSPAVDEISPKLIVLSEQLRGQKFDLVDDVYTIGRSEKESICIVDPTVSGLHCELRRDDDGNYTAHDLGSTNGTRINGARISEQKLVHSDILQVGGVELMFDCEGEDSVASHIKTQTQIDLGDKADLKPIGNLGPWARGRSDNPRMALFFKIAIPLLITVVIVLMIILIKILTGK